MLCESVQKLTLLLLLLQAVPHMDAYAAVQAVGILGAVIMPHNVYLYSGLVLSRKVHWGCGILHLWHLPSGHMCFFCV